MNFYLAIYLAMSFGVIMGVLIVSLLLANRDD